jgi:hypothetical protein
LCGLDKLKDLAGLQAFSWAIQEIFQKQHKGKSKDAEVPLLE